MVIMMTMILLLLAAVVAIGRGRAMYHSASTG